MNQTIKDAFWASRPISWINTGAPFLLGYLLGFGRLDTLGLAGFFYFLIPYNIMLYGVNDIFDYESDVKNPRKSGIEGALIAKERHRRLVIAIVVTNLPFILTFLSIGPLAARLWFAFVIAMNLAYSIKGLRFKEIPIIDSFTSSTHFYSPFVYGLLLSNSPTLYWPALFAFVAWGMASHAFGAVQDIPYDRQAGIGSIATVFGLRATLVICTMLYLLTAGLALTYGFLGLLAAIMLGLYAINSGVYVRLGNDEAPKTNRGWRQFLWLNLLVGFWLTQLLLIAYNPFGLATVTLRAVTISLVMIGTAAVMFAIRRIVAAAYYA